MSHRQPSRSTSSSSFAVVAIASLLVLQGCTTYVQQPPPPPRVTYQPAPISPVASTPAPQEVVSVYVEPPLMQPAPVAVQWAPPPLLVEVPPPMPFDGAAWVGGYWHWQGRWVWARGRWLAPPQPSYAWVQPYYENRGGTVIFIGGHWSPPGVVFVPPPPTLRISMAVVAAGAVPGPAPIGPAGVFIPPPPGSRPGLIVPAPIGTPPAVVTSAPPVVNVGMRVTNVASISNVTNVSRVTNVTIVAPPGATASGQPVRASVPAQPHLAAALAPQVRAYAPEPVSAKPIPPVAAAPAPAALPPQQPVRATAAPIPDRGAPAVQDASRPRGVVERPQPQRPATRSAVPEVRGFNPQGAPRQAVPRPQREQRDRQELRVKRDQRGGERQNERGHQPERSTPGPRDTSRRD